MNFKLGDVIYFKKSLIPVKKSFFHKSIDREATKEFAIKRKIGYIEGEHLYGGFSMPSKWWVKSYQTLQKGMVCGARNIWINGKQIKVYLIARNMAGFDRVPEEFIESVSNVAESSTGGDRNE